MLHPIFDRFWHKTLERPYRLNVGIDAQSNAPEEIVLLHGIGRSSSIWQPLVDELQGEPYHVLAFDLLGFGDSPKPDWPQYNTEDHANAVIAAIRRSRKHRKPVVLVGHSMGCLIAVQIALQQPKLVKRLILYQLPLYEGLPNKRRYKVRKDLYYRLYERLIAEPTTASPSRLRRLMIKHTGLHMRPETMQPFLKSLEHTIMEQTTLSDMRNVQVPIDVIYGSRDMVVIRGKPKHIFKEISAPLETHTIRELHTVSQRAAKFIAVRIRIAERLSK
jgi:pimeloyl-ACP methyl ester carboxylesterase